MNKISKILISTAIICALIFIVILIRRLFVNDVGGRIQSGDRFHIRIALINDSKEQPELDYLARLILYPETDQAILYSVSTDARYEVAGDPISSMSAFNADQFRNSVDSSADYHLYFTRESLARAIDLLGGMNLFLENNNIFKDAEFQYPAGFQQVPGRQMVEYAVASIDVEKGSEHLAQIDRLYRGQSLFLNLLWQYPFKSEQIENEELFRAFHSLADTDMDVDELRSLFKYFEDTEVNLVSLEVPLYLENAPNTYKKQLIVQSERSRSTFEGFEKKLITGLYNEQSFPVDVENGTETGGLAGRVKKFLHGQGLDVLYADNFEYKPLEHSVIIERSGSFSVARRIMEMTGRKPERVFFRRESLDIFATFAIGLDFRIKDLKH